MPGPADLFRCGRLVVVSPHLDDAALSLGATIARASQVRSGVSVVTVLAGDPESSAPASAWDRECGFSSAAEATRGRRAEDKRACEILGAEPVWLPFGDEEHDRGGNDDEIWASLSPLLDGAGVVLVPGYPLAHLDHAWLTRLVVERSVGIPIALYVEQPYAANIAVGRGYSLRPVVRAARLAGAAYVRRRPFAPALPASIADRLNGRIDWRTIRPTRRERRLKNLSIRAYPSQFGVDRLGQRLPTRIHLYEVVTGGEHVGLLDA